MQRYRSRGQLSPGAYLNEYQMLPGSPTWELIHTFGTTIETGTLETMTDAVTPGFSGKRARGEVIMNSMKSTFYDAASSGGGVQVRSNSDGTVYRVEGNLFGYMSRSAIGTLSGGSILSTPLCVSDSDIADACTQVSTAVAASRGRSKNNLYESIAEADQAIGMVGDATKSVRTVLSRAEKQLLSGRVRALGGIYLLYRYGLKPLCSDIENIVQSLSVTSQPVRETTRSSLTLDGRNTSSVDCGYGVTRTKSLLTVQENVHVRAMSLDEYVRTRVSEAGLDSKGLFTLPWELIPYSFVIDWFTNVGDLIGAITPTPGVTQLGSCITIKREYALSLTALYTESTNSGYSIVAPCTGNTTVSKRSYTRGPISPSGFVVRADFKLSNLTRALDGISLVVQKLKTLDTLERLIRKKSRKIGNYYANIQYTE